MDAYTFTFGFLVGVAVGIACCAVLIGADVQLDRLTDDVLDEPNPLLPYVDALIDDHCETCTGLLTDDNRAVSCDAHDLCVDCAPFAYCPGCQDARRVEAEAWSERWL
jgi:hypothetical protein